jgi:hypothetical protein
MVLGRDCAREIDAGLGPGRLSSPNAENRRKVKFGAYTSDCIRVNVNGAPAGYARITEIESWTP